MIRFSVIVRHVLHASVTAPTSIRQGNAARPRVVPDPRYFDVLDGCSRRTGCRFKARNGPLLRLLSRRGIQIGKTVNRRPKVSRERVRVDAQREPWIGMTGKVLDRLHRRP